MGNEKNQCALATNNEQLTTDKEVRLTMAFTTARGRTRTSLSEINVTPLVDVVLVLLVIFMLTAPILESGIEVDLPKTKTVKELSDVRLVITIDRAQRVYLGDKPVNIHELGQKVRASATDPAHQAVYVRCDETRSE